MEQVAGRVPVVVNSGAAGTALAVHYSRAVHTNGADALMVMPPNFIGASNDEAVDYFRAISDAVALPIFIQDTSMVPVSTGLARRLAAECEWVRYIKVESRSEERRVGKECRSRWSPYQEKKKKENTCATVIHILVPSY